MRVSKRILQNEGWKKMKEDVLDLGRIEGLDQDLDLDPEDGLLRKKVIVVLETEDVLDPNLGTTTEELDQDLEK